MKNNFFFIFFSTLLFTNAYAENLFIQSKNISLDKNREISIFENEVLVRTEENNEIKSDYAEYDKKKSLIKFKNNILVTDNKKNKIEADFAEYNDITKIFKTNGPTKILTNENYTIFGEDITLNNKLKIINSNKKTVITDQDGNIITLNKFEYLIEENIFKSIGFIEIKDNQGNSTKFSQVYIDTNKKEILGTDVKSFINQKEFKINEKNKPRVFSNTIKINNNISSFGKSIFTICDYREKDKCPPWTLQSSEMKHDRKKKTIFYNNAVIKIYDIPIFYTPYLSHPDPSVKRRSGFLPPSFSNSKNLGSAISIPYFFDMGKDKDFTLNSRFYGSENPILMGEYRQAFERSNLIFDFGYTEGYKKTSSKKKSGEKYHFFSQFIKDFVKDDESKSSLKFNLKKVSNDKYLELYKIKTDIVDYNEDVLESSLTYDYEKNNTLLRISSSIFENLKEGYNDKYEFILPEITYDNIIFSDDKYGYMDLKSNFKVHNYDTNKTTKFLINDFDWDMKNINFSSGLKGKLFSSFKNVNYETKNEPIYKEEKTSEFFSAFGYLTELDLFKRSDNQSYQKISPKLLLRYAPGNMSRKEDLGSRLDPDNIFNLDRLPYTSQIETGLSASIGFDYELNSLGKLFNFSAGQIINEKENRDLPAKSSLDQKTSDLVGAANLKINKRLDLNYKFALDHNYNDLNYNEIGATFNLDMFKFNLDYLQEKKHIGNNEYIKAGINIGSDNSGIFSFKTKKNLIKDSSEYYDLSYEYINDCLRAGLVYRREFYEDSELETENSLMFKITLIPFGSINAPSINK